MSYPDAVDIGDGVEWAGLEDAWSDPEVACARSLLGRPAGRCLQRAAGYSQRCEQAECDGPEHESGMLSQPFRR